MLLTKRNNCPCCEGQNYKKIFSMPYDHKILKTFLYNYYKEKINSFYKNLKNEIYILNKCKDCSTIFQEYIPSEKFSYDLYEKLISQQESLGKKQTLRASNFRGNFDELLVFEKLTKKISSKIKILEFGSGWGYWSKLANSLNFDVTASELSNVRKEYIKSNGIKILNDLENTSEKFDIIYSDQVFEHINYPKKIFNLLYKTLNKGGYLFIKFPDSLMFQYKINKNFIPGKNQAHPLEHINLYFKNSFKYMIRDMNMSIINFDYYYNFNFKKILKIFRNYLKFDKILLKKN
jgi:2-polyprenyl-3-methyl-5-hydroxy-6-metoxy-1,4-benzoquinol methylase